MTALLAALPSLRAAWAFLSSPFGRWLMVVVGVGYAGLYGYNHGLESARAECQAEALRARLVIAERDLAIAKAAAEDAGTRASGIEAAAAVAERKVKDYEAELAARPAIPACRLDERDAQRLRSIQ